MPGFGTGSYFYMQGVALSFETKRKITPKEGYYGRSDEQGTGKRPGKP
jgi:hypothetical protein